jgi:hypothetical protein
LSYQFLSRRRDVATTDVRTRLSRRYHGNCLDFGENSVAALNIPTKRRVAMATTRAPRRPVSFQTKIKNRDADAISTTRRTRSALPTRLHYRKDSQIGTVTLKMERLCAVCKGEGKYKCPICLIFYCSVQCCKKHRENECDVWVKNDDKTPPQPSENRTIPKYTSADTVPLEKLFLLSK